MPIADAEIFPIPLTGGRLGPKPPEQSALRRLGARFEEGEEIDPVELRVRGETCRRVGGGRNIQRGDGRLVGHPGRKFSLPLHEERHPDATLGQHPFLSVQRGVERTVPPSGVSVERRVAETMKRSPIITGKEN